MNKNIYVGGLGEARVVTKKTKNAVSVTFVLEEDGTESYQLCPDEHSDQWIKTVYVIPKEKL